MLQSGLWFAGSMVGIILVARFALYEPAQKLARAGGLSRSATGQLLGYLTSAPELVATVFVASTGLFAVVSTNILGSNIVNTLLATVAAVWFRQMRRLSGSEFRFEQAVVIGTIVVPIALLITGQDDAVWSGIALFAGYLAYLRVMRSRHEAGGPVEEQDARRPWRTNRGYIVVQVAILVAGLVGLYVLGDILGDSVYELGVAFAVPAVILGGLTAIATSLPELTTFFSSYAAHRKAGTDGNSEVMHNLMASNAVNLLLVQAIGVGAFTLFA
jgi:Ca2+/Na+ antiporter